jgi:hypothetical protein
VQDRSADVGREQRQLQDPAEMAAVDSLDGRLLAD